MKICLIANWWKKVVCTATAKSFFGRMKVSNGWDQSPYNKVLCWALFMIQNLIFGLSSWISWTFDNFLALVSKSFKITFLSSYFFISFYNFDQTLAMCHLYVYNYNWLFFNYYFFFFRIFQIQHFSSTFF